MRAFLEWDCAARLIEAPTWQEIVESSLDPTAEEADENALRKRWERSLEKTIERCFSWIGLKITRRRGGLSITPIESWRIALGEVRAAINGVGIFWFPTDDDLVDVGPYKNSREAVLNHIHYAPQAADVYGYEKPTRTFERVIEGGRA